MSPRKKEVLSAVTATADPSAEESTSNLRQKTQLERIPSPARFVLVVLSSLALSAGFFSLASETALGELGGVSRHLEAWWEVGGLTAWKAVEVGLAWILGFDGESISFSFHMSGRADQLLQDETYHHSSSSPTSPPTLS
jgi:hypothetical protein